MFLPLFVCLSVCLFVRLSVARISQKVLDRCSCKFVKGSAIGHEPTLKILDCAHYPYIMRIVNIHKQAELTENNGLDSSIVYRIE